MRHAANRSLLGRLLLVGLLSVAACPVRGADPIKDSLDRAASWLAGRQNPDGGYGPYGEEARLPDSSDVGLTAIVLYALGSHPRGYTAVDGPFISRAVELLLARQQPDGGFYDPRDPVLKSYRTSVVVLALSTLDRVAYAEPVARARRYLRGLQLDESKGYEPETHLAYGGIGYGNALRPNLSTGAFAADALYAAGEGTGSAVWRKLERYTSACQNAPEVSPLLQKAGIGTTGDWGFRYAPNDSRGPVESIDGKRVFSSYGSMTYQGLKTLLYARVGRDDPRIQKAFEWISRNFSVKENPGMATPSKPDAGRQGLYYYYHTMAKTLAAYGEPVLVDSSGRKHDWARELSRHLLALQEKDGSWANREDRWWENLRELDTAFAMVSLKICRDEIARSTRTP